MVEALLLEKQKRGTRPDLDSSDGDNGGCGATIVWILLLVVFFFVKDFSFDDLFLTKRLNARFGADTTEDWELQELAVTLIAIEHLGSPTATELVLKLPENRKKWKRFRDLAYYWEKKLKDSEGKKALKKADAVVEDNFDTCVEVSQRIDTILKW